MIAIVGNLKIDESKPDRIKYLITCIRSYRFLRGECRFVLGLDTCSDSLFDLVKKELLYFDDRTYLCRWTGNSGADYGGNYVALLRTYCKQCDYVINFMEDHFMVLDDIKILRGLIDTAEVEGVDIIKSSFFQVEKNSSRDRTIGIDYPHYGFVYSNTKFSFEQYCKHYGSRYYIGVNFITPKSFADFFWDRSLGKRPHEYEVAKFSNDWVHRVMIPHIELQCAIDDDHGEPNTCLLKRSDCEKWNQIWKEVK